MSAAQKNKNQDVETAPEGGQAGAQAARVRELFEEQVAAFAAEFGLDNDIVERALRDHAQQWGGCMSCVFSRPYSPEGYELSYAERWKMRSCLLGLRQDFYHSRIEIPEE